MLQGKLFRVCVFILFLGSNCFAVGSDLKVLVLIITSDQLPIYRELQKIWKSYMHSDPQHIEAYFIRGNPHLPSLYEIKDDVIWSQTEEGWSPASAGIINKTVLSLEALLPRLHEFDYIVRTNLSSFYVFPRLLKFLETLPKTGCYAGSHIEGNAVSGSGYIISPDVAQLIVKDKYRLLNHRTPEDDLLMGEFMSEHQIGFIHHDRMDFYMRENWDMFKNNIPVNLFHFRVKTMDYLRLTDDIFIHHQLLRKFYA